MVFCKGWNLEDYKQEKLRFSSDDYVDFDPNTPPVAYDDGGDMQPDDGGHVGHGVPWM